MRLFVGAIISSVAVCVARGFYSSCSSREKVADVLISRSANLG
jgi:hypothetical protein